MNTPECARRHDLLLSATRWIAITNDPAWVLDTREDRVHLSSVLQNLLRLPDPVVSLEDVLDPQHPIHATRNARGHLAWIDPLGHIDAHSEWLVVHHGCPLCAAAPIELGLLIGLPAPRPQPHPELVAAAVSIGQPQLCASQSLPLLKQDTTPTTFRTATDPFQERFARIVALYADIPESYRALASRHHHPRASRSDLLRGMIFCAVATLFLILMALADWQLSVTSVPAVENGLIQHESIETLKELRPFQR